MDDLLFFAARFAQEAHAGQRRKYSGRPYVEHPARVAARAMLLHGATSELVAAAWLHDVIEDCSVTDLQLRDQGFPAATVSLVVELTNPSKGSPAERAERKRLDREHSGRLSRDARRLKALDRVDNLAELDLARAAEFASLYAAESVLLATALGDIESHLIEDLYLAVEALGFRRDHCDPRTG